MSGYLYAVENETGLVKIGYTNDPVRRLTMLRTSSPEALRLVGVLPATMDDERAVHAALARYRVVREWFRKSDAVAFLLSQLRPHGVERPCDNAITHIRKKVFRLTQQEFAVIAGVQQSMVSRWENGHAAPTLDEMARIRAGAAARRIRWSDKLFFEAPSRPAPAEESAA